MLFDVGAVIVKAALPTALGKMEKFNILGNVLGGPTISVPPAVIIVAPRPVHTVPFVDVAMLFPPFPTATHKPFEYTTLDP